VVASLEPEDKEEEEQNTAKENQEEETRLPVEEDTEKVQDGALVQEDEATLGVVAVPETEVKEGEEDTEKGLEEDTPVGEEEATKEEVNQVQEETEEEVAVVAAVAGAVTPQIDACPEEPTVQRTSRRTPDRSHGVADCMGRLLRAAPVVVVATLGILALKHFCGRRR